MQEDISELIINDVNRTGTLLPFFTGAVGQQSSSSYFFNGYYNYNLNLVFVNPSTGEITGNVPGYKDKTALSSLVSLGGNKFAASRFSFAENFIAPQAEINPLQTILTDKLGGLQYNELPNYARVRIKKVNIAGKESLIYATETQGNSILLLSYNPATAQLTGARYLGHTNPYRIGNVSTTSDGALIVLGKTFVAGRYERLCLFKLSPEETSELAN